MSERVTEVDGMRLEGTQIRKAKNPSKECEVKSFAKDVNRKGENNQ